MPDYSTEHAGIDLIVNYHHEAAEPGGMDLPTLGEDLRMEAVYLAEYPEIDILPLMDKTVSFGLFRELEQFIAGDFDE